MIKPDYSEHSFSDRIAVERERRLLGSEILADLQWLAAEKLELFLERDVVRDKSFDVTDRNKVFRNVSCSNRRSESRPLLSDRNLAAHDSKQTLAVGVENPRAGVSGCGDVRDDRVQSTAQVRRNRAGR